MTPLTWCDSLSDALLCPTICRPTLSTIRHSHDRLSCFSVMFTSSPYASPLFFILMIAFLASQLCPHLHRMLHHYSSFSCSPFLLLSYVHIFTVCFTTILHYHVRLSCFSVMFTSSPYASPLFFIITFAFLASQLCSHLHRMLHHYSSFS